MSYDITLNDPVTRKTIHFDLEHQLTGGTYALGGTTEAWLNITYNYAEWYYRDDVFGENGIRTIYDMTGADSIPVLKKAIKALEDCKDNLSDDDIKEYEKTGSTGYWIPTRENAIKPLYKLLAMAKMRGDGIWNGD